MMTPAPVTFRSRLWRWTRRLTLFSIVTTLAAGAAVYVGLPVVARQPRTQVKVEKMLSKSLGTAISMKSMEWSWKSGLTLQGVTTPEGVWQPFVTAESVQITPNYKKLLRGKVRLSVLVNRPEVHLYDSEPQAISFPKFSKHTVRLDRVEIRDGAYVLDRVVDRSPGAAKETRIEHFEALGTGRLERRTFRLEFDKVTGSMNGETFTGKGMVRVASEGLKGELDVNEPEGLREALRAGHITIKKAPALSEPF